MFLIGEALIGEEPEIAHVDLIVGDKDGAVGNAFANGMTQLSQGHTPLLSVIRPNLPVKPSTLIVPKVTVQDMDQAAKIFGPAQTAVAKAIADAVEEGLIPKDQVEDIVIIASVFIHPKASNYAKIFRYNYGATKLALKRALKGFPDVEKVLCEKDRSTHPIMGFKVTRLWDPPYLQVALDIPVREKVLNVIEHLPQNDHLILEAGTPLIKRYGLSIIEEMRKIRPDAFILADLKTLDTGNLEARMAADSTADGIVVSGLAPINTIDKVIDEAKKTGIYSFIDMLNVDDPLVVIKSLKTMPDVVELHRAIDDEHTEMDFWQVVKKLKKFEKLIVSVAGGIRIETVSDIQAQGVDILVVGRAITNAKDIEGAAREFLKGLNKEDIDQFRVMTDF